MATFIAFLRGINVGGKNPVKMNDVADVFTTLRFHEVKTYLQSGNVVFKNTAFANPAVKIETALEKKTGLRISVIVRSREELEELLIVNPYRDGKQFNEDYVYLTLFSVPPAPEKIAQIKNTAVKDEYFEVRGDAVFVYVPNGYGRAKANNGFFEKKLQVTATTRNIKTVGKMIEMAAAADR
jgi:uncharacterized protein (DUF1697 family)